MRDETGKQPHTVVGRSAGILTLGLGLLAAAGVLFGWRALFGMEPPGSAEGIPVSAFLVILCILAGIPCALIGMYKLAANVDRLAGRLEESDPTDHGTPPPS